MPGNAQFLPGDEELLSRAAEFGECPQLSDCSQLKISEISTRRGIDFATAVLYDRALRNPIHSRFFQQVQETTATTFYRRPLVGIVPGAFYREHKGTGADGVRLAAILQSIGCRVERVPIESFGSLKTNAALIAKWLSEHHSEPLILLTLSKGSADVKMCLRLEPEKLSDVAGWISLSGLPDGTPLVSWLRRQPLRKLGVRMLLLLRGQRYSVVEELRCDREAPLKGWPASPVPITHVVAVPLRRHLTHPWAPRGYERIAPLGPNDGGGFLLSDVAGLPGVIFPVWGADHYLQPAWDATSLLSRVLAEAIASGLALLQTNQSAARPINPPASKSIA
jgi:hypothetical protein